MPSPQAGSRQALLQASPSIWLPSSHCSGPSPMASPQRAIRQPLVQASLSIWLPSSHCSLPSRTPLPHCGVTQDLVAVPVTVPVVGLPARTMPCLFAALNFCPVGTENEDVAVMVSVPLVLFE